MIIRSIKIVDPFSTRNFHDIINAAIVSIGCILSKSVTVLMGRAAHKSLLETIKINKVSVNPSINYRTYLTCEGDSKYSAFIRTLIGFWISLREYFYGVNNTLILYNYTNQFAFPFILVLNRFLKRKIIFTLHGELELQNRKIKGLRLSRVYRFIYKICFKYLVSKSHCQLLVLGKTIKKNILDIFPELSDNIIYITHPYFIPQLKNNKETNKKLTIGTIGTLNKDKGLHDISKIINSIKKYIRHNQIEFRIIGRITSKDAEFVKDAYIINSGEAIPIEKYNDEIKKLDLIIFCYPNSSYKLTASGAIMDAIVYGKPIITYHNDFFDDILSGSNPGLYANNDKDITAYILEVVNDKRKISCDYSASLRKISILENAKYLRKELSTKNLKFIL